MRLLRWSKMKNHSRTENQGCPFINFKPMKTHLCDLTNYRQKFD